MSDQIKRRDGVSETDLDDDLFLVDGENGEIYHLDRMAQAIWHALAEPVGQGEMAELFVAAFPEQDPARIRQDVETALAELIRRNLIVPA